MADPTWPSPTPRDEVLARVVTRGERIRLVRRLLIGGAVAGVAAVAAAGVWLGANGTVDLVGDAGAPATVTGSDIGDDAVRVSYFACPNREALGTFRPGDRVYLTSRDASGDWVEVRSPVDDGAPVWIRADVVEADEAADLPESDCATTPDELPASTTTIPGATTSTTGPGSTTTTTAPGATTAPPDPSSPTTSTPSTPTTPGTPTTRPTPTPTTPTPTTTVPEPAPIIGSLSRSQATIVEQGGGCPGAATSTVTATISNATSATMSWNVGPGPRSTAMQRQGNTYVAVLGPFGLDAVGSPPNSTPVTVTITAAGPGGTRTRTTTVALVDCYFG